MAPVETPDDEIPRGEPAVIGAWIGHQAASGPGLCNVT